MSISNIIILVFAILIAVYAVFLYRDIISHKEEFKAEKGNIFVIAAMTSGIQFLATMGISDFNLSIPLFRGAQLVDDKRLPGTLLTAAAIPGCFISIIYISSVDISLVTLICCLLSQSLGTVAGIKMVSGMKASTIRRTMGIALIVSTVIVLTKMIGFGTGGGTLTGLSTWTLVCIVPIYFLFGVVNMMGFGVKALSMSLLLSLGIAPVSVLMIVLSCCGVGSWSGAMQYVKNGAYQRKIAAVSSVAGIAGVAVGSFFVRNLNTNVLQWIMVAIMVYTAVTMLSAKDKEA